MITRTVGSISSGFVRTHVFRVGTGVLPRHVSSVAITQLRITLKPIKPVIIRWNNCCTTDGKRKFDRSTEIRMNNDVRNVKKRASIVLFRRYNVYALHTCIYGITRLKKVRRHKSTPLIVLYRNADLGDVFGRSLPGKTYLTTVFPERYRRFPRAARAQFSIPRTITRKFYKSIDATTEVNMLSGPCDIFFDVERVYTAL